MNNFFFLFLCSCVLGQNALMSFNNRDVLTSVFFQNIPRSTWVSSDSLSKQNLLDQFKERELVYHHSLSSGYDLYPDNFITLYYRKNQLLINSYYERVVASSFISDKYLLETQKNIFDRVFVYHLLLGFKGSGLKGDFLRSKEESFFLADSLKIELNKKLALANYDEKANIFSVFSKTFSEDPSVNQNGGKIGWISWGQVMPSFQSVAFNSSALDLSGPVLTDFGYHLVFVEKKGFSDYYYYNKNYVEGLVYKFGLQQTNTDSLRVAATLFDSLYIKNNHFVLNEEYLNSFVEHFTHKTKTENLRGGKNIYIEWLNDKKRSDVLFVFKNKGFGIGWLINKLQTSPATRVPTLRTSHDFVGLIQSFLLQEGVLVLSKKTKLDTLFVFRTDLENHFKNVLFKFYEKKALNQIALPDSSLVLENYNNGVYRGEYLKPREVVFSEVRFNSKILADSLLGVFSNDGDFDFIIKRFGGKLKKPISEGGGGFLGEAAFSLKEGGVSSVIENLDKSFSIIRVERFLEEEPFTLAFVYSQIERKLKKTLQDSVKKNLSLGLYDKYKFSFYPEVLSF